MVINSSDNAINSPIAGTNCYLYVAITALQNMATIQCTFLDGQAYSCLINCSSVPSGPYSYSYLTDSGLVVFGVLNNLTSGHKYYCKVAAVKVSVKDNENMTLRTNFTTLSLITGNESSLESFFIIL